MSFLIYDFWFRTNKEKEKTSFPIYDFRFFWFKTNTPLKVKAMLGLYNGNRELKGISFVQNKTNPNKTQNQLKCPMGLISFHCLYSVDLAKCSPLEVVATVFSSHAWLT